MHSFPTRRSSDLARDSAPKQTAAAPTQQRQTPSSTRQGEGGAEHRVSSNETLWDIAARHRSDSSVSVQQMMVAIKELNPFAYIYCNFIFVSEMVIFTFTIGRLIICM